MAPRRPRVRHRRRRVAAVARAHPPRQGRRTTDVRAGARAPLGVRARGRVADGVAAPRAADEEPALLDHVPDAPTTFFLTRSAFRNGSEASRTPSPWPTSTTWGSRR